MRVELKKNQVQKMMSKCRSGVAPKKHDQELEMALISNYLKGDEKAGMDLAELYIDFFSVIMNKPSKPPFKAKVTQKIWTEPTFQDYEDLFQEILYQFFLMIEEYDEETAPFGSYVASLLHQRVFDRFFSEFITISINEEITEDDKFELESHSSTILIESPKKTPAEYIDLYQALNRLGKRQREVLELSIVKGWNSSEIATELGISSSTVRVNLKKGLTRMRELLTKEVA